MHKNVNIQTENVNENVNDNKEFLQLFKHFCFLGAVNVIQNFAHYIVYFSKLNELSIGSTISLLSEEAMTMGLTANDDLFWELLAEQRY